MTAIIHFAGKTLSAGFAYGTRLSDILKTAGIQLSQPCGGSGRCGKCRLKAFGKLSEPDKRELDILGAKGIASGLRLACIANALGDVEIYCSDEELTFESFAENASLPEYGKFSPICTGYAVAADIGTTTVALWLCDMSDGRISASGAFANPQRAYGADVITRLGYAIENTDGAGTLQKVIIGSINSCIKDMCNDAGIENSEIHYAVLAGNTVMEHFAAGYDARGIANSPFTVSSLFGFEIAAVKLGLDLSPEAPVYLMPCFSAYVGGDIASGLAAAGIDTADESTLFIDVGTNGEMGLGSKNGITLCSVAAGPAFEGAHIECGCAGINGAIDRVWNENGRIKYTIIGSDEIFTAPNNAEAQIAAAQTADDNPIGDAKGYLSGSCTKSIKPKTSAVTVRGICGSGLIDCTAALLDSGIIDESGCLDEPFYLNADDNIYISPTDIREIQLAKAAVCAGVEVLLDEAGIEKSKINKVILAGGFGSHIDPHSACRIGLIPRELESKVTASGNTAGKGAVMYLTDSVFRERIRSLPELGKYLELSSDLRFSDLYIENMMFEE